MAPGSHALIGWWTANVVSLQKRDRLLVFLAGILADLDGLGLLFSTEAYLKYHHILCHNLFAGLICTALVALFAKDRKRCALLTILNWHLHLAADYFGSGGPPGTRPWVLPYLYPVVGSGLGEHFTGPEWYWNPWQWPLNAWPNLLITFLALIGWVYIAVRLNRTWFEFIWPAFDREVCKMLRKWFGSQGPDEWSESWSPGEGKVILKSYLVLCSFTVLACVVAASRTIQ